MSKYKDELKKIEQEIYKIMLDSKISRYKLIPYIARWAAELKYREETKDWLDSERINKAIYDVLTNKVTIQQIKSLPPLNVRKKLGIITTETSELQSTVSEPKSDEKEKDVKKKK